MTQTLTENADAGRSAADHYDAIVIGAGQAGLYQLHLLRQQGLSVRVIEAGAGVGGTWYWNRYPGCRLDSESHSYQYFFANDMLEEWNWSELFAGQPELERYYNTVADKYDLRKDIEFNTRVLSMTFDEGTNNWTLLTDTGKTFTAHVVVSATGLLSAPIYPQIPGMEAFKGESYHTALWPKDQVTFSGKKVIVIGTGASGVQVITEIAKDVDQLTIFQRTPNWVVPLRNRALSDADMDEIRAGYPELHAQLRSTFGGFIHSWDPTPTTEYTEEQLIERYEKAWREPGFAKWFGLPKDVASNEEANKSYVRFLEGKIRSIVNDQRLADNLVPDHLFGTKRVPGGTEYYEVYNKDNVKLIPLAENPILEVTPTGVKTAQGDIEADMIVYATGFEAFVGALNRIDVTGVGGKSLRKTWEDGPVTLLGVQVSAFPNLFMVGGPHGKGGHGNSPRCGEDLIQWIAQLAGKIIKDGIKRVEADPQAEAEWTNHVYEVGNSGLMARTKSAFFGDNIPGRKRAYLAYSGALPDFVERIQTIAKDGYPGFILTK